MDIILPASKTLNDGERLELTPIIDPVEEIGTEFQWYRNGIAIPGATSKTLTIEAVSISDEGNYTISVMYDLESTVSAICAVTVLENSIPVEPDPIEEPSYYIHNLSPTRDCGFTWIGWWVLDELQKATDDNFDWKTDPTNERFKYPLVIKSLADGLNRWGDVEMQESRNGYILSAKSFVPK